MRFQDSAETFKNQGNIEDPFSALNTCRTHLESLQNLRYLIHIELENPYQVRLYLRIMEWHLTTLAEILIYPSSTSKPPS